MALPTVNVVIQNGGLGKVTPSDDRVVGLMVNGIGLGASQIFSYEDALAISPIVNSPDGTYAGEFLRQVSDFYKVAGSGAELWVIGSLPSTSTADLFAANGQAEKLMLQSGGRVNVIGVSRFEAGTDVRTPTLEDGLDPMLINALDDAHAFAVNMATQHMPVRVILDGQYSAALPARVLTTYTYNRVQILMSSNRADRKNTCIGLLLGRYASIAPNTNIGRVKDGPAPADYAYNTAGARVETMGSSVNALNDRGYVFLRTHTLKAGYYWSDDKMATGATDDYSSMANGRVVDKAARIAYATFLEELLDTVQVDPTTGKIAVTTVKQYQATIERAIGLTMAANGEISGVQAFIDPAQDILATSMLVVDLRVTPTGTNRVIVVKLGLNNPNAQ